MSSLRWKKVGRWYFEMSIIKILLDMLNRFTKVCNTLYIIYPKKENKKAQKRLDALKVLENKDYIMENVSSKTKQSKYYKWAIFASVIMVFSLLINFFLDVTSSLLLEIFYILILLFSLSFTLDFFLLFLFSFNKYLRKILFSNLIFINAFIFGDIVISSISDDNNYNRFVNFCINLFKEYDLHQIPNFHPYQFWLIFFLTSVCSCISLFLVLKTQDIFEIESMETENRFTLLILAILTFIIGIDIDKIRLVGIFCLILVIQTAFFEATYPYLLSKMYEKAQNIFQEQLVVKKPSYEELKRCYFWGGEKYKEKLLSTEKFLEVIVKNELKSLKNLKNYDDYKLYKAVRASKRSS